MSQIPLLLAFGIVSPWTLLWLAAAAAPVLIHFLSRRRHWDMPWAAMDFLLAALRRQARRLRFEQLLLLALRVLVVVLAVVAVAQPYPERGKFSLPSGGRTHRVLVIDGSLSMSYRPTEKSRFDRAKETALRIVKESARGDAFTLVLMAAPPRVIVGTPAFEAAQVKEEIDNLEPVHTGADVPATLKIVQQLVERAQRESTRLKRHEVCFLTDLNRVNWAPEQTPAARMDFQRQAQALMRAASVLVIDVGQPAAENVAVIGLATQEPLAVAGRPLTIQATLKNFGSQPRLRQAVELLIDGRQAGGQELDLPPGGEVSAVFPCRLESPGDHVIEVQTEGDNLEADNHRWLVLSVRRAIRVLCINGRPSGSPYQGATDYLAAALAPQGDAGRQGRTAVEVAPESALLERELAGYDCVFLCDVAQFTASEARVLQAYLGRGGSLVFFLGPGVLAERYNVQLGGGPGGAHILPATLGEIVARPAAGLDPLDYRHPIVKAFEGSTKSGLLTTPVARHYRLEIAPSSSARVVLATNGGDPLVVEQSVRRGRVVLVATSADRSWTAMPLWPSYVPLWQELVTWCAGGQGAQRNLEVGDALGGPVPAAAADAPVRVQGPSGKPRTTSVRAEGGYADWSYGDTTLAGLYTAAFGAHADQTQSFAVNLDPRLSDLAQVGEEELKSEIWPAASLRYQTAWRNPARGAAAPSARPGLWHVGLLYAVLVLLLGETLLAWRFGHHGT